MFEYRIVFLGSLLMLIGARVVFLVFLIDMGILLEAVISDKGFVSSLQVDPIFKEVTELT